MHNSILKVLTDQKNVYHPTNNNSTLKFDDADFDIKNKIGSVRSKSRIKEIINKKRLLSNNNENKDEYNAK